MLDRVPVPTDNIYKFYALFSLVLFVFSIWMIFKTNGEANAVVFQNHPEIAELKAMESPTAGQSAKLAVLERQIEIATSDRSRIISYLGALFGISICLLIFGFVKWHTEIQVRADAQTDAQLEIMKLQIEKLRLENQELVQSLQGDETSERSVEQPSLLGIVVKALVGR